MKICVSQLCPTPVAFPAKQDMTLSAPACSFTYFTRWQEVPEQYWELADRSGDLFLQRDYLSALEKCPPAGMEFGYILFQRSNRPAGIAYYQVLDFRAKDHLRREENSGNELRERFASHLNFRLMVCGNMLLTGQHAYYFPATEETMAARLLQEALGRIALNTRRQGQKLDAIALKDLEHYRQDSLQAWQASTYHEFRFQPNMVLPIRAGWQQMDDYLEALSSKYRVRYRRARKKLQGISRHELNEMQIRSFEKELYQLYAQVADGSDFCMAYLHPAYFSELKSRFPEDFRLWAYFRNDALIGFCTSLRNGSQMEAHFLGLDKAQNNESQLYLNMLYDLVETAISGRVDQLIFSRTALEIKSSVGAIAEPTSVFLNYPFSPILNCLTPSLVRWLEPKAEWEARHPFRDPLPEEAGHV